MFVNVADFLKGKQISDMQYKCRKPCLVRSALGVNIQWEKWSWDNSIISLAIAKLPNVLIWKATIYLFYENIKQNI